MATYATDLQTVHLCDSNTNISELSGHTSGSAPAATTENYYHNSTAVDQATGQATGTGAGMEGDYGSNISWTSGHVFMAWQKFDAGTNIYGWAAGGMRFGIGSASGDMNFFNALGDDFGNYPLGGWQNTAIDPEVTADATDGTPVAGNYRYWGSVPNMRAKITKGSPHCVDAVRYGRGELQVTGTGATFTGMAAANDALAARWGLFQKSGNNRYKWKGLVSLGLTATAVTFNDSNKTIDLDDTPRVGSAFNKIEINNASSSISGTANTINGVATSITGSAPVSPGDWEVVDNATLDLDGWKFNDLGYFIFQSNSTLYGGGAFTRCGQVTQGGGTFTNILFDKSTAAVAHVVDSLGAVTGGTYISSGTGHAVNLGTISADTTVSWDNDDSGYAATNGSTGNETILVNVASGFTLTINVEDGRTTPTYYNTGAGTVSIVANQLTLTIKGWILNAILVIYDDDSADPQELGTQLQRNNDITADETYTYAPAKAGDDIVIVMIADGYKLLQDTVTLGAASADYPLKPLQETN